MKKEPEVLEGEVISQQKATKKEKAHSQATGAINFLPLQKLQQNCGTCLGLVAVILLLAILLKSWLLAFLILIVPFLVFNRR